MGIYIEVEYARQNCSGSQRCCVGRGLYVRPGDYETARDAQPTGAWLTLSQPADRGHPYQ